MNPLTPRTGPRPDTSLLTLPVGGRRGFLAAALAALGAGALLGGARTARAATQASSPYIGEIMLFGGNFAPMGWLFCDGSLLPIAQYETLFALIGTTYGGDGQSTFAVPDLRGRIPIGARQGPGLTPRSLGEAAGNPTHTLLLSQLPVHSHAALCSTGVGTSAAPAGALPARSGAGDPVYSAGNDVAMAPGHLGVSGAGQPHPNLMPFLTLNYCIAHEGIFPPLP